jgi:mono/diheme cytochrome c family protein
MRRPLVLALATLALAALLAACGNQEIRTATPETVEGAPPAEEQPAGEQPPAEEPPAEAPPGDAEAGREIFTANCGSCHTLADAGTTGAIGPNLDESLPAYELVIDRVTNGAGAMPPFAGVLSDEDIQNVAAYVVQATAGG